VATRNNPRSVGYFCELPAAETFCLCKTPESMVNPVLGRPQVVFLFWITFRVQQGSVVRNQLAMGLGLTMVPLVFAGSSTEWPHLGDVQEIFRWNVLKDSLRMFVHKPILGWAWALLMSSIPHTGASIQPSMSTPLTMIIFKS
jgi:hypothetical protein